VLEAVKPLVLEVLEVVERPDADASVEVELL
jgi:hypothetical protein